MSDLLVPDPSLEFKPKMALPDGTEVYGVLSEIKAKQQKFSRGKSAGRTGVILNCTFHVLCGEHAGRDIYGPVFVNVETTENLGQYTQRDFNDNTRYFKLLKLLGHIGEVDGQLAYMIPRTQAEWEECFNGTGRFEGKPMLNTPMGVKVGTQQKEKWDREKGSVATDENGNSIFITVNNLNDFLEVPTGAKEELTKARDSFVTAQADEKAADDNLPW